MKNFDFHKFVLKVFFGVLLMSNFSFFNFFSNFEFLSRLSCLYAADHSMQIYKSTEKAAKKVGRKYHLHPGCIGIGTNKNGEDVINIGFDWEIKPLLIDEAREKLIACFQDFLSEVNRDQKLLKVFPNKQIKIDNIDFFILNFSENHIEDILHPFICVMSVDKGTVGFYTVRARIQPGYERFEETYEEALEKLQKQKTKNNPLGK